MWDAPCSPVKLSKMNLAAPISPLKKGRKDDIPAFPQRKVLDLEKVSDSFCTFSIESNTPISNEASPAVDYYASCVLSDAEALLANIRRARAEQVAHAGQLSNDIRELLLQATLEQMVGGCYKEAEESTLNANHLSQERELILSAISTLDWHILMMESDLEDARLLHVAVVDCSEHQLYEQELQNHLHKTSTTSTTSCAAK
jgi:hypothetical protein